MQVLLAVAVGTGIILTGRIGSLAGSLIGRLILRAVLTVAVRPCAVLAVAVHSCAVLAVAVRPCAVLIAVSAVRAVVLCICVLRHFFLHSDAVQAPKNTYLLMQAYYLTFRRKIYRLTGKISAIISFCISNCIFPADTPYVSCAPIVH